MPVPVIAAGVYELLAAGAAATGVGAFAAAKKDEIADALSDAGTFVADSAVELSLEALPWIIAATTGTRPIGMWRHDEGQEPLPIPVSIPKPVPIPLPVPITGTPTPPLGPEDPLKGLRRLAERAKEVEGQIKAGTEQIAKNRFVRGIFFLYKLHTYGLAALSTAEIGRRMITDSEKQGPLLYDYGYKLLFGESVTARTLLGGQQLVAEETTVGMLALALAKALVPKCLSRWLDVSKYVEQLPGFLSTNAYAFLGTWSFIEHQMTANNTDPENVDFNRATRSSAFFGFTSLGFFIAKDVLINLKWFGRIGFSEWWMRWGTAKAPTLRRALTSTEGLNWGGAQLYHGAQKIFGERFAAWAIAPKYIPSIQTVGVYSLFAAAYRNVTQAIASLPLFEDSDMSESLAMANFRSGISTIVFDPYLLLGVKSNSVRSIFGNQIVFMGLIYSINQYFSPFDGKDLALKEADRTLKTAFTKGREALAEALLSKPLTQRNLLSHSQINLSVKTWAELTLKYANEERINPAFVSKLTETMKEDLHSKDLSKRRVGMALGVMLSQVAITQAKARKPSPKWSTTLAAALEKNGVRITPSHADRSLSRHELNRVFKEINAGRYDETPLFQFPG